MTPADAALELLTVVGDAYTADPTMTASLIPGQVMVDDWCWGGCGTAYVRLNTSHHSASFPTPVAAPSSQPAPLVAQFHVGVNRCVHGMADDGTPPTPKQLTEDALVLLEDLCTLHTALTAWIQAKRRGNVLLGAWTPVGPLGDCAGGFWTVTLRL